MGHLSSQGCGPRVGTQAGLPWVLGDIYGALGCGVQGL